MTKFKAVTLLIIVIVVSLVLYAMFQRNDNSYQKNKAEIERLRQIKELTVSTKQGVSDEKSANEMQKKLCLLTARSTEEQSKAIEAVRDLVSNPKAEVVYKCSDAFFDATQDKLVSARSETYTSGQNTFLVNPQSNHIIQANLINKPLIKATRKISQSEAEKLVRDFISQHSQALGEIDLSKLKLETGKKGDDVNSNYFFLWQGQVQKVKLDPPSVTCSKDIDKKTPGLYLNDEGTPCYKNYESNVTPIIQVAINNQGQILNYASSFEGEIGREITF